jgi:hypothetical protein
LSIRNEDIKDYAAVFFRVYTKDSLSKIFEKFQTAEEEPIIRLYSGECINNLLKFVIDLSEGEAKKSEIVSAFLDKEFIPSLPSLLNSISKILKQANEPLQKVSTSGLDHPVGGMKITKSVEILVKILSLDSELLFETASSLDLYSLLTNMILIFPWSNIMHGHIERFISTIIQATEKKWNQLFKASDFVKLFSSWNSCAKRRKDGNRGLMVALANQLLLKFRQTNEYSSFFKSNPLLADFRSFLKQVRLG